jgi:glycosyltransferase involved in cell wall biosynthesis
MKSPFFSVVIPVFNREDLVEKVINCVLNQSFKDFELIVVDNCSTDKTVSVVQNIQGKNSNIKLIANSKNLERCISRNLGAKNSIGEYVCFLDSDDFWLENHLEELYNSINETKIQGLYFTNAYDSINFGPLTERICPEIKNHGLFEYLLTYTFNPSRVSVHKSILEQFDFDPEIPGLEDFDLWLRIATKFPVFQVDKRTVVYNIHEDSTTATELRKLDREIQLYKTVLSKKIFKNILPVKPKNRLMSMCYYRRVLSLNNSFNPFVIHYYILKAFVLFPKGYNKNTNSTMFVIFIDQLPVFGYLFKKIRFLLK